jgi:hypothetical protein
MSRTFACISLLVSLSSLPGCGGDDVIPQNTGTADTVAPPPDTGVIADTVSPSDTTPSGPNLPFDTISPSDTAGADTTSGITIGVDPSRDPCKDVPTTGRCKGRDIELCVTGTGNAEPFISISRCDPGTACVNGANGPTCAPTGGCTPYDSECRGSRAAFCDAGQWVEENCPAGCRTSLIGAICRPTQQTLRYQNSLAFEFKIPNDQLDDWSDEVYATNLPGALILSFENGGVIDAAITDAEGHFTVDAVTPQSADGDDWVAAYLLRLESPIKTAYALLDPGVTGVQDLERSLDGLFPDASYWQWAWTTADIPSGEGAYLPLAAGSAAAFVYAYVASIYDYAVDLFGPRAESSLAFWFGLGTSWSCGACFTQQPYSFNGDRFGNVIFMPGNDDEGYWSDPVIAHEMGHWVMSNFGVSPGEGGVHYAGVPTHPGMAWSEGFATWFSSFVRDDSAHFDKQKGLFFVFDLAERVYIDGRAWNRPVASEGLEQLIDENEIAAMLLSLTTPSNGENVLRALSSPRMTQSPFLRGYENRFWEELDANYLPLPAWSTGESAPHFADYLDALVCAGSVSGGTVDAVTEPWLHYPYPSAAPLCRRASAPISVTYSDTPDGVIADVRWYIPLEADLELSFVPALAPPVEIPAGSPPGSTRLIFATSKKGPLGEAQQSLEGLSVRLDGRYLKVHGTVPYRDRPVIPPARTGPSFDFRGKAVRGSIPLKYVAPSKRAPLRKLELP